MPEGPRRRLQLVQLNILQAVDKVCREHGITYFLAEGTLLGAIRHQGFIPWDDDLDIAMYRGDYQRFQDVAQSALGTSYFVQTWRTDPGYGRYITKVRAANTLFLEKAWEGVEMHHGIFIDIFPLDHVARERGFGLNLRGRLLKSLNWAWALKAGMIDPARSRYKRFLPLVRPLARLVPSTIIWQLWDFIATLSNKKGGNFTTSFASGYGWEKELVRNSVYGSPAEASFEGQPFPIPERSDILLGKLYGNYMEPPPPELRDGVHSYSAIEFGPPVT